MTTTKYTEEEVLAMSPKDFRAIVRKGEWTGITSVVCEGYAQGNLAIVPKDIAGEFLLFCNRNPSPCPVIEVTDPGDPHFKRMAPEADIRTDVSRYRVYRDGVLIDKPTDVLKYWRDDLVAFLIGNSGTFEWALRRANIVYKSYCGFLTNIPCVPTEHFHGPVVVTCRGFFSAHDAVRAIQISSRYPLYHGAPIHIGDPVKIGVSGIGKPDDFNPYRPTIEPPGPDEILLYWGCGITPGIVAEKSKIPFMITHAPRHLFITDKLAEEMVVF